MSERIFKLFAVLSLSLLAASTSAAPPASKGSSVRKLGQVGSELYPAESELHAHVYIDTKGKIRIRGGLMEAGMFSEDLAVASPGGTEFGYLNPQGKWHIRPKFEAAEDFHGGLAAVALRPRDDPWTDPAPWGFIDRRGKMVIRPAFAAVKNFSEGLAPALGRAEDAKWGFIGPGGTYAIAPQFDDADAFSEGLARVVQRNADRRQTEGFVDVRGTMIVPPRFHYVQGFSQALAAVSLDGKSCGYLNRAGDLAIASTFRKCGDFHEGLAPVKRADGWCYIDAKGQVVIPGPFLDADVFAGDRAPVETAAGWHYIGPSGQVAAIGPWSFASPFKGALAATRRKPPHDNCELWIDRQGFEIWSFCSPLLRPAPVPGLE